MPTMRLHDVVGREDRWRKPVTLNHAIQRLETIDEPEKDREAAIARLKTGIASMRFLSEGPLPSREASVLVRR